MDGRSNGSDDPRRDAASEREAILRRTVAWTRYSTIGIQFTLAALLFGWLGYHLDERFGWEPWGLVTGLVVGFAGATLWLYYKLFPRNRDANRSR